MKGVTPSSLALVALLTPCSRVRETELGGSGTSREAGTRDQRDGGCKDRHLVDREAASCWRICCNAVRNGPSGYSRVDSAESPLRSGPGGARSAARPRYCALPLGDLLRNLHLHVLQRD